MSALVFAHNEADLIPACLESIAFCREVVVVDLVSQDDSAAVARACGARVIHRSEVPAGKERLVSHLLPQLAYDWVLLTDPDMVFDPALAADTVRVFADLPERVGTVAVPMQCFFGDTPLRGTLWGGISERPLVYNRRRVRFPTDIHAIPVNRPGFSTLVIPHRGGNVLRHYWMRDEASWLEKHRRYVRAEADDRRARGERFSICRTLFLAAHAFAYSFVWKGGYRDGTLGVRLSWFWTRYVTSVQLLLRESDTRQLLL